MNEEPIKRGARRAVVKKAVSLPISEVKTKVTTKKVTAKKAVAKKVTPEKAEPKTKAKAAEGKVTQKRGIKSPFSAEMMAEVTETNVDPETVKMVTGPLSPRLKEKLALYELWYRTESPKYAENAAKLFGYGFIISGFLLAFALTTSDTLKQHGLLATLKCAQGGCPELATTTPVVLPLILPTVTFTSAPVVDPLKDTDITITVANAPEHSFHIISEESGASTRLEAAGNDGAGMFMYRIPTRELTPGEYKIYVRATASDTTTKTEFAGSTFTVPTSTPVAVTPEDDTESSSEDEAEDSAASSTTPEVSEEDTSTEVETEEVSAEVPAVLGISTTTEEVVPSEEIIEVEEVVETEEVVPEPEETEVEEGEVEPVAATQSEAGEVLAVSLMPGIFPLQYKVSVIPTFEYSSLELSIRAENSTAPLYLGTATKSKTGWLYWLDASTLPAGKFRILVSGLDEGVLKDSTEIRFENKPVASAYLVSPEYEEVKQALADEIDTLASATTSDLAVYTDPRISLVPALLAETTDTTAGSLIADYADDFNPLLRRYASARQSGDATTLRLAEAELETLLSTILDSEVTGTDESVFALESELRVAVNTLKDRILAIENYKKERTAAASSVDTDEDGVTDYDEYLLYDTDPKEADTDRDGVLDGVEISLGYDPTDSSPEAVIRLHTPEDITYVDDEVLSITAVTPLLVYETDVPEPLVQSEISGFGLPNSFVTLFIYGEPTVVVVKTTETGQFSYTFTKELKDGEHEVYATLIDNAGDIVLRSSAFRFAKTGTSYNYPKDVPQVAAAWSAPVLADASRTYNLVATMGVVAFGLILLLMALALRQDRLKPEKVATT